MEITTDKIQHTKRGEEKNTHDNNNNNSYLALTLLRKKYE